MGMKICRYCLTAKVLRDKPRQYKESGVCLADKCVAKAFQELAAEDMLTEEEADWLADYKGSCRAQLREEAGKCTNCQVTSPGHTIKTDADGKCIACGKGVWVP